MRRFGTEHTTIKNTLLKQRFGEAIVAIKQVKSSLQRISSWKVQQKGIMSCATTVKHQNLQ